MGRVVEYVYVRKEEDDCGAFCEVFAYLLIIVIVIAVPTAIVGAVVGIIIGIPIASLYLGSKFQYNCPINPGIPDYLVAMGIFYMLLEVSIVLMIYSKRKDTCSAWAMRVPCIVCAVVIVAVSLVGIVYSTTTNRLDDTDCLSTLWDGFTFIAAAVPIVLTVALIYLSLLASAQACSDDCMGYLLCCAKDWFLEHCFLCEDGNTRSTAWVQRVHPNPDGDDSYEVTTANVPKGAVVVVHN